LQASQTVEALDAIDAASIPGNFELLAREVRDAIERHKPQAGLDRLHTFVAKFVAEVAVKRGVLVGRDKPLHSVFGEYVKKLRAAGLIETDMAERILKSTISIFQAFNDVRNDASLAHPNPPLRYDEALLIYNNVCNAVRFVKAIESAGVRNPADEVVPQ
jgi:hypothetical protein